MFALKKRGAADYGKMAEEVLGLAEELAEETGTRCVVFLDEFPSITDLKNAGNNQSPPARRLRELEQYETPAPRKRVRKRCLAYSANSYSAPTRPAFPLTIASARYAKDSGSQDFDRYDTFEPSTWTSSFSTLVHL